MILRRQCVERREPEHDQTTVLDLERRRQHGRDDRAMIVDAARGQRPEFVDPEELTPKPIRPRGQLGRAYRPAGRSRRHVNGCDVNLRADRRHDLDIADDSRATGEHHREKLAHHPPVPA